MIVGTVEVDVRALVNSGTVTKQISDGLQQPVTSAGQTAGKTLGRHVGESAAQELEKSGARFARSGRLLSNVFTSNSAAALGPLQEVADKVDLIGSTLEQTRTKAGGMLLGIGAAATGVGAFLSTLASREEGATNRLAASIGAAGGNINDYRDDIDKAVKAGERLGQSGNQTIDALQALTIGLHDPKKALDELGLAENIAAAKQISLSSAANLVRQAYNGNTRVLKAFGIQVADVVDGQKLLADAHDTATKATSAASKAQKDYSDKLAIYRNTLQPTLAQQIALKNAHDKLADATAAQTTAQQGLTTAQSQANAAGSKGQEVLNKLAQITAGQASASANTFTGHLKAIGASLEDNAAKIGGKVGHALITFGPALAAGGFLIESGLIPKVGRGILSLIGLGGQAGATAVEMEAASVAEVASLDTVVLAIRELQVALTGIGPAAGVAAGEVGTASEAMVAELGTVDAAAATATGSVRGIAGGILGLPGLIATAGTAATYELNKWYHAHPSGFYRANDPINNFLFGKRPHTQDPIDNSSLLLPGLHPQGVQTSDAYDAKTAATLTQRLAMAGQKAGVTAGKKIGKAAGETTLQAFLDSINGGKVADAAAQSALSKQISAAQKAAADNARALGKTVTDGLRAQVDSVKHAISGVNDELKKMSDLRGSVVSQAAQFLSLSGALSDPSRATAGGLVSAEEQRVAALRLFGLNITKLRQRHLDPAEIADILKQGPDGGRQLAAALAQATDAQIGQLNLDLKAGRQQAQVLGSQAVEAQFGVGAQAKTNATLARLLAEQKHTNALLSAEPALIGKAVDQARKNATVSTKTSARTAVTR